MPNFVSKPRPHSWLGARAKLPKTSSRKTPIPKTVSATPKPAHDEARRIAAKIAKLPGPRGVGSMRPITPMSPATSICFPDKTDFVQTRLPLAWQFFLSCAQPRNPPSKSKSSFVVEDGHATVSLTVSEFQKIFKAILPSILIPVPDKANPVEAS